MRLSFKRSFDGIPVPRHFDDDNALLNAVRKELPNAKVAFDYYETCEGCMVLFIDEPDGRQRVTIEPIFVDANGNWCAVDEVNRVWVETGDDEGKFQLTDEKPRIGYQLIDQVTNCHVLTTLDMQEAVKVAGQVFSGDRWN